jgi:acetate---CoA ligase (ADP-forming)
MYHPRVITPRATMNGTDSSEPSSFERSSGRLRDGTLVHLRPAVPADLPRILDFLAHTSSDSLSLRYLRAVGPESAASEMLIASAAHQRLSLLLETDQPCSGTILGHGEFICTGSDPPRAEVAFLVADERQGVGAATMLLLHLARHARREGVQFFDAIVLPENGPMIDVFVGAGFPCSVSQRDGLEQVVLDISREPMTEIVPYESQGRRPRLRA